MTSPPLAAIALLSAAALGYEILLMRLFSIILWHHFAYMMISVAIISVQRPRASDSATSAAAAPAASTAATTRSKRSLRARWAGVLTTPMKPSGVYMICEVRGTSALTPPSPLTKSLT